MGTSDHRGVGAGFESTGSAYCEALPARGLCSCHDFQAAALATLRTGNPGSAWRHRPAGLPSPRPPLGCTVGTASSESGSLHKPPPQLRCENQSRPSHGLSCIQNPPRGRGASTPSYPGSRGSDSSVRRYHVCSRRDAPLRRSLEREVGSRAREHRCPRSRAPLPEGDSHLQ